MQKVILVTGASSGLGKEIAKTLSQDNFVYAAARNVDGVEKDKNIKPLKLDVTSDKECRAAVEKIIKEKGRIDILINNAGYSLAGPTIDFRAEDLLKIIDTNTLGGFRLIKEVFPFMKRQKYGRIINITSLNGLISFPNFGLYSSSKHGLEALGIALHYELEKYGILVTNLAPGAIKSDGTSSNKLPHKSAREKFKILYFLMPMITRKDISLRIRKLINFSHPPVQVVMGMDAKITTLLKKLLPSQIWDLLMEIVWNKK